MILDRESRIISVNRATENLSGMPESRLIGLKCFKIFHSGAAENPPAGCPFLALMESGSLDTVEMEMEALGKVFLVSCTPVLDPEGGISRVIHIATDITRRKQAEAAVRESLARFEAIVSNTPMVAMQGFDRRGVVRMWNRASEELYGYPAAEALGMRIQDVIQDPEDAAGFESFLALIEDSGKPVSPREWRIRTRGGNLKWVYSTTFAVRFASGDAEFYCMDVDITELKAAQDKLRETEEQLRFSQKLEAMGRLAGGIAHDFNNILTVINGFSELLLMQLPPEEADLRPSIVEILESGRKAMDLTGRLLAFSRKQVWRSRSP